MSNPNSYKAERSCLKAQITQWIIVLNCSVGIENNAK